MGHAIRGLVARFGQFAAADHARCVIAPLAQDFGLGIAPDADDELEVLERIGERLGHSFAVAFVSTDYFGGTGTQAARVWRPAGATSLDTGGSGTINAALALIGVTRAGASDEFDSVGLGWYRSNDDWAAFARYGKADWQQAASGPATKAWKARRQSHS